MAAADDIKVVVDYLKQWKLSSYAKPAALIPKRDFTGPADRNYWLKNNEVRKFLQAEDQPAGINIGWTTNAEPETGKKATRWFVTRNGTSTAPVKYGENVALACGRQPSFLCHEKRTVGVDLAWRESPDFEWQILGGKVGEPIDPNQTVALYNNSIDEFLIYFNRTVGGDVGWPSSKTWGDQVADAVREAAKNHLENAIDKLMGRD
jgi:hypothetical protein